MSRTEALLTLALELPEDERELLATAIQASLPQPSESDIPTPVQLAELQRRVEAIDKGTAEYVTQEEFDQQLDQALLDARAKRINGDPVVVDHVSHEIQLR